MKAIHLHTLSAGALVLLTFVGGTAAQTTSSALLNSLEVRELITRAQPGDNARLAGHFAALAEQYAADARRHTAMAQAFIGTPAKQVAVTSASDHCKRLARLNTQSAETLKELAAYHRKLASGAPAIVPKGGGPFQSGTGAPEPSDADLIALASKAGTPAEHHALEAYFLSAAKRYTTEANEHAAMASAYRGTKIAQAAAHCDRLAQLSRDEAKEASALATEHKQLAGLAR